MWCVRERGLQALQEPENIERLSRCDEAAIAEIDIGAFQNWRQPMSMHPELAAALQKAGQVNENNCGGYAICEPRSI